MGLYMRYSRKLLIRRIWAIFLFLLVASLVVGYFASRPAAPASPSTTTANGFNITSSAPAETYRLRASVAPEETGFVYRLPRPDAYEPDTQVTLKARARPGYAFDRWDGLPPGSPATVTLTMDSDKDITAHFKDATPPEISKVDVSKVSYCGATIAWETDEDSIGWVEFGISDAYGARVESNEEQTTIHGAHLTGLEANTTYQFKVMCRNTVDLEAEFQGEPFTTPRTPRIGYEVGHRAPPLTLQSYHDDSPESPNKGQPVTLSDYQGKIVLLNFWTTFCGSCLLEFPFIREIYQHEGWADNNSEDSALVVFTVCVDGKADRIQKLENKFAGEVGLFHFPILLDEEGTTKDSYHALTNYVWTVPKTVFIDSDGIIRRIKNGRFHSTKEIEGIVNSL